MQLIELLLHRRRQRRRQRRRHLMICPRRHRSKDQRPLRRCPRQPARSYSCPVHLVPSTLLSLGFSLFLRYDRRPSRRRSLRRRNRIRHPIPIHRKGIRSAKLLLLMSIWRSRRRRTLDGLLRMVLLGILHRHASLAVRRGRRRLGVIRRSGGC